jgi:16S rRNA (cytosine1402-N4)-methyltransferase
MTKKSLLPNGDASAGSDYHIPVLFTECMDALQIKPEGTYVDCTFGGGGHSRGILERLGEKGRLIAFDQDADAQANLPDDDRITFVPQNFVHLSRFLRLYQVKGVDGLLADLGVSSHQFDEGGRGFSYRFDAALDMRMDTRQQKKAADILNTMPAADLQQMFSRYGEVTNARTLAAAIVSTRATAPFASINDLLQVLEPLSKGNPNRYYAQVFQALRIEVNDELGVLETLLEQLKDVMNPGGSIAIITFHSLEDRIVKQFFKEGTLKAEEDVLYGKKEKNRFRIISKKPIEPGAEEVKRNVRARSARLRVAEFLG